MDDFQGKIDKLVIFLDFQGGSGRPMLENVRAYRFPVIKHGYGLLDVGAAIAIRVRFV